MIRAVYRDGRIQPLDPLPEDGAEGRELRITDADPGDDPEAVDRWHRELSMNVQELDDPADWATLESSLAEADRQAKSWMRREMGLE